MPLTFQVVFWLTWGLLELDQAMPVVPFRLVWPMDWRSLRGCYVFQVPMPSRGTRHPRHPLWRSTLHVRPVQPEENKTHYFWDSNLALSINLPSSQNTQIGDAIRRGQCIMCLVVDQVNFSINTTVVLIEKGGFNSQLLICKLKRFGQVWHISYFNYF